jgi:ribosomal protein L20A (L18A)
MVCFNHPCRSVSRNNIHNKLYSKRTARMSVRRQEGLLKNVKSTGLFQENNFKN